MIICEGKVYTYTLTYVLPLLISFFTRLRHIVSHYLLPLTTYLIKYLLHLLPW